MNEATTHGGTAADATHYQTLAQQPIEIMQRLMTKEQFLGFLHGNVVKYALRCGHKDDPAKEMEKVRQYADWYVRASGGETIDPRSEGAQSPAPIADVNPWIASVKEFDRTFDVKQDIKTRLDLLDEEINELGDAVECLGCAVGLEEEHAAYLDTLDAICDSIYVLIGLALKMGFDLDGAFREVHRSNMSKLGEDGKPIKREDGKILKGPNFTPPDLTPYI